MQEKANKKKTRSQAQQQEEELIKKEKKTKKKHEQVGVSNPPEIQSDVALCGACRSWIFFINGVIYFLKMNGSRMEKEER